MTAHKKKTTHKKAPESSRLKKGSKILLAALVILVGFVLVTDRKQLPESFRDHPAAKTVYSLRDRAVAEAHNLIASDKPLNITAEKKQKPEQGYTAKDRDSLEDLLREEGVAKQ